MTDFATHFAAYDDIAIHGIGETADGALADARANRAGGAMKIGRIKAETFDYIKREGFDGSRETFTVDGDFITLD